MGAFIGVLVSLALTAFGFIVMRNPARMAVLSPGMKGYYQRVMLDTSMRNQLRVVGLVFCLFGASVFTFVLNSITKAEFLRTIGEGIWVLLNCVFCVAFCFGLVLTIRQLTRGQFLEWLRMWRRGTELAAVESFTPTPAMRKEAAFFTLALFASVFIAAVASLLR
ncbi:MAG: hypothetical protein WA383_21275 [Terriglobales bacterium]|jgi:hypothetical protein